MKTLLLAAIVITPALGEDANATPSVPGKSSSDVVVIADLYPGITSATYSEDNGPDIVKKFHGYGYEVEILGIVKGSEQAFCSWYLSPGVGLIFFHSKREDGETVNVYNPGLRLGGGIAIGNNRMVEVQLGPQIDCGYSEVLSDRDPVDRKNLYTNKGISLGLEFNLNLTIRRKTWFLGLHTGLAVHTSLVSFIEDQSHSHTTSISYYGGGYIVGLQFGQVF